MGRVYDMAEGKSHTDTRGDEALQKVVQELASNCLSRALAAERG
jgi:hypothetical protein